MALTSPDRIQMGFSQQQLLRHLIRAGTTAPQLVLRARIVFAGRLGVDQPDDRRAGRRVRGHRRQVASPLVGSAGHGLARRCEEVGSATVFHPGPGRRPQGAGLSATRSQWCPAVAVELPGPGRTGRR